MAHCFLEEQLFNFIVDTARVVENVPPLAMWQRCQALDIIPTATTNPYSLHDLYLYLNHIGFLKFPACFNSHQNIPVHANIIKTQIHASVFPLGKAAGDK